MIALAVYEIGALAGSHVRPVVYMGAPPLNRISNLRIAPKNIPTNFGDRSSSRL